MNEPRQEMMSTDRSDALFEEMRAMFELIQQIQKVSNKQVETFDRLRQVEERLIALMEHLRKFKDRTDRLQSAVTRSPLEISERFRQVEERLDALMKRIQKSEDQTGRLESALTHRPFLKSFTTWLRWLRTVKQARHSLAQRGSTPEKSDSAQETVT